MAYNNRAESAIVPENVVGQITKSYSADGEVIVRMWDNFPQNILDGDFSEPLWVEIDAIATPFFLRSFKTQGTSKAVAAFEDITSEQLSAMVVGKKIYAEIFEVTDSSVGSDLSYLEGFTFTDINSNKTGVVTKFVANSLNPLLEVDFDDIKECLVPVAEPLIEKLSRRKSSITMRLPDGFFD